MVDLELTREQLALQELASALASEVLRPAAASAEENAEVPDDVWSRLGDSGLVGGTAEASGGQGCLTVMDGVLVAEELGCGDPGLAWAALAGGWVTSTIDALGGAVPAAAESWYGAPLVAEGFAREPTDYRAAVAATPAGWLMSGAKDPVVNATRSSHGLVVARDEEQRLSAYVIDRDALRSLRVLRDDAVCGTLGLRASASAKLALDGLLLPLEARLADGDSVARAIAGLRLLGAATAVGLGRAAVAYATAYAEERVAFGSRVIDFQAISFLLVDLALELEVVRLSVWETAAALDAVPATDAWKPRLSATLARAGELLPRLTRECVQVLGGHGFLTDHPVERWYRDAMAMVTHDPGMSATRLATTS